MSGLLVLVAVPAALLPGLLAPPTFDAVFSAPILKLRAVGPGLVASVSVAVGQPVEPGTLLLTLHADHLTDAVLAELWTRLERAQTRQALAGTDQRQASATALEIDQLQRAITTAGANAAVDLPVRAGVNGTVWALDAQAGARTLAGDMLVQLSDCGRAFLTLGEAGAALKPGSAVLVHMSGVPAFRGTVRPSAGPTEPAGTLVVAPTGLAAVAQQACPVGASATVQPSG